MGSVGLSFSMVADCDNARLIGEIIIDFPSELEWEVHKSCGFGRNCGFWFVLAIRGTCFAAALFAVFVSYLSRHFV